MTNKLPQGWVECELKDIAEDIISGTGFPKMYQGNDAGDYPFAKVGDISKLYKSSKKIIDSAENYISEDIKNKIKGKVFPLNTIVFPKIGEALKGNYRLITKRKMLFDNNVMGIYLSNNVDILFLYYFLTTQDFGRFSVATTVPSIQKGNIEKIKINLPPLNEQKRIVEKIEEEFEKIDEGVEKLKLAQEQIKQYRQSVLKSAFEGKLTGCEIKLIVLSDAGEIVTGTTPSTKVTEYYNSHDFPFYKPTDLNNGYNTNSAICYVSKSAYENHRKLPINSILVTCIGATIGKTGIIRESGICNQQINAIIPNKEFIPEYIYFQCISDYFQEQIKVNASATTLPILNKSGFSKLKFLTCKLNEQKQIVKEIEKRFEVADEVEKIITENLEKAEQLKQSILKKAFEGRLVPQNPTDQPAAELLAQIQAEREK